MSRPRPEDALRHRLRRRLRELSERQGEIPPREIEEVEKLAALLRLRDDYAPSRRGTWLRAGILLLVAALSLLLFVPVRSTGVSLDLEIHEVGFTLVEDQKLTDALPLESVGVGGLREIHLPRGRGRPAEILRAPPGGVLAVRLTPGAGGGESAGRLTLASLAPPAGSRCWLAGRGDRRVRLSLRGDDLALKIDARGPVTVGVPGRAPIELDLPSPRGIGLVAAGRQVDLDLVIGGDSERLLTPQLSIEDLSFVEVEELVTTERSLIQSLSTIRSGVLYFESLGGRERPLRRGEMLRFAGSSGRLRSLRLADDQLAFDFRGRVRGMTLGVGRDRRSLMPSHLVLLHSRRSLGLYLGVAVGLLSFLQLFRGWWRSR